jgi:cytoskeletal protein RodZ
MRRVLGGVGRALVTVGLLLLLFVAYQLWGTGIYQARAQNDLQQQFEQAQREAGGPTTSTAPEPTTPGATTTTPTSSSDNPTVTTTTSTTLAPLAAPPEGKLLGAIHIPKIGVSQYVVEAGEGLAKAFALAERIAANAPLSNFAVMHALPRIADMAQDEGLFVESLMAAIASGDEAAKMRVRAFLEGRAAKVSKA